MTRDISSIVNKEAKKEENQIKIHRRKKKASKSGGIKMKFRVFQTAIIIKQSRSDY